MSLTPPEITEEDDETVAMIKELLDTRIRCVLAKNVADNQQRWSLDKTVFWWYRNLLWYLIVVVAKGECNGC